MNYVEIAVDVPVGPNRTFTYNVPEHIYVAIGQMVRVSFANRAVLGIVFGSSGESIRTSVLDVVEVVSDVRFLTETQLILARWVSEYYHASLYQVAITMLPPGMIPRSTRTLEVTGDYDKGTLNEAALKVLSYIENHENVSLKKLIKDIGRTSRGVTKNLIANNIVTFCESVLPPRVGPKMLEFISINNTAHDYPQMLLDLQYFSNQRRSIEFLHAIQNPVPAKQLRAKFGAQSIRALLNKGFLKIQQVRSYRAPARGMDVPFDSKRIISNDQDRAVREIQRVFRQYSKTRKILLWGIAGSGKTEVYLRAMEECLAQGRTVIMLVPDISLTAQTVAEVVARFPNQVAVLHSGLSPGEQFDQWQQILSGSFRIVVGVRSAVFAPVEKLGLIVVDEEHDWNYKQSDKDPRYHARDVAVKLADLSGAVLILGSATPDVESYHSAQHGRYTLLQMHRRPDGRINPSVRTTIVDMRTELREGNRSIISRELLDKLSTCLDRNGKAILFINRRGAAQSVQCRSCGYVASCSSCDTNLIYHSETNQLNCHYCGKAQKPLDYCPSCNGIRIRYLGLGTQRVVQELELYVPGTELIRYDSDVARKSTQHDAINARFRSPGPKIMVGTQMLAKGLDFPDVSLVGIVLADLGLSAPNFRASERSFQLLAQVAGRAGRREDTGEVVIQTYLPDHYVVKALAKLQYVEFVMQELAYREQLRQPPFARHVRVICQHFDYEQGRNLADRFTKELITIRDSAGFAVDVLGPMLAYPHRLNGKYRWQLVLRGDTPMEILLRANVPIDAVVDVDPVDVN